ncbi:4Fe-4S binding protein [Ruminiclostridium cellobioparum]|jgi:ferredoxin-type protein NapH|uniref:4Fe-4S binding protein n=1 Tax=Ruminiclostridium cellobioparum TaxID=29355 RepID=UPI000482F0D5|nr:4Fe-4S binding protein [Ruminiclostridium cellobioparum]
MKLQKTRNALLLISLILFPVTINYLSPYLIVSGSFEGIASGSFLLFSSLFVTSLFFGRAFCGWICPAGSLQDCCTKVNNKPVSSKINVIKYMIWIPWVLSIAAGFITAGGISTLEPTYLTDYGISVNNVYGYLIYLPVAAFVIIISFVLGRRSHCHAVCWIAPFVIAGSKIKNKFKYPSLHLEGSADKCIDCKICDKNCPMSLSVSSMVKQDKMYNDECILCGNCSNVCSRNAVYFGFRSSK